MSLLEQKKIKKYQVNKLLTINSKQEFDIGDNKEYKIETICNYKVYTKKSSRLVTSIIPFYILKQLYRKQNRYKNQY